MVEKKPSILEKIKKQFTTTIPDDYELEFDFCMKCGERLGDKMYSTLKKHQIKSHQLTKKKKAREFFYKHILISIIIIMLIGVGVIHLATTLIDILLPDAARFLTKEEYTACLEQTMELNYWLYETGSFGGEHIEEFNRLLNDCHVDFFAQSRLPTIFENDNYIRPEP